MLQIKTINWINKDKLSRKVFSKFEVKKLIIKSMLYNKGNSYIYKIYYDKIFKKFVYNSSIARYRTNCIFLGNSRSIFQRFKLSRHSCKNWASQGLIPGLRKSSF